VQNVDFPSPQSVNVGVVFAPQPQEDGSSGVCILTPKALANFSPGLFQPWGKSATTIFEL
jgi:hypothetical protein